MITNFEGVTHELTEEEISLVPIVCQAFEKYTKDTPIKAPEICKRMNMSNQFKSKFTEVRLRKIVNYIRTNSLIPLIATSSGYFVDYSSEVLGAQIQSLKERANSIYRCAQGLEPFLEQAKEKARQPEPEPQQKLFI